MNPAVVQIHSKKSTVCHACADRTLDIIQAAKKDARRIGAVQVFRCRHCKLDRASYWFVFDYGLDAHARVVPLELPDAATSHSAADDKGGNNV